MDVTKDEMRRVANYLLQEAGGGAAETPSVGATGPRIKLGVVRCHNERQRGAVSSYLGQSEYDFFGAANRAFKDAVVGTTVDVEFFERRYDARGYRAELVAAYAQADAWGADLTIEPHFNAASSASASGTETLHCEHCEQSELFAHLAQGLMVQRAKLRDRGVKDRREGTRGYYTLVAGRAPAILTEFSFAGSNDRDAKVLKESWSGFARDLIAALNRKTLDQALSGRL